MRRCLQLAGALALAAALPACGPQQPPVASLEVYSTLVELPHGRFVPLELAWRVEKPLEVAVDDLLVFIHLRDEAGNVVRTFDHPWPGAWHPGGRLVYPVRLYQSALAAPLAPGSYELTLGLYDLAGDRWPVAVRGEEIDRHEYRVGEVRVPLDDGGEPMFQFSASWLATEPGRDRQVLARRWLGGPGELLVSGVGRPGGLWLQLRLPTPGAGEQLVLADGADQQGAVVRACGEVEVRLSGPGSQDILLPLAVSDSASCTVEIEPDFYLLKLDTAERRTLSLEVLAWAPDPG